MPSLLAFFVNESKVSSSNDVRIYGSERRFLNCCEHFAKMGTRTYAVEICPPLGGFIHVPFQSYCVSGSHKGTLLRLVLQGIRLVRRFKCDAVLAYNSYFMYSLIPAYLTSFFTRKPLITFVLDFLRKPQDELSISKLFKNKVRSGSSFIPAAKYVFLHLLRRIACRNAVACFCASNSLADYAHKYLRIKRVYATGGGIEEFWFDVSDHPICFDGAYMGRIDPQKGLDTLLEAWQTVLQKRPNAKLVIIGSGSEKNEKHLREKISSLKLSSNVNLAGYHEGGELTTLLRSSGIFIFPSLSEGGSAAVAEAMAAGLPCIISDIPALREIYSKAAILVPPLDSQSLGKEVLKLLDSPALAEELIKKGQTLVSGFRYDNVATFEHTIIISIIKSHNPR